MKTETRARLLISVVLWVASILISAIAWARITRLSLPCPLAFPITNIVTTLAGPALIVFFAQTAVSKKKISAVLVSYLRYFLTLLPFTLLILALVYTIQSDMLSCSMESRWMHLFRAKDENSIRTIQSGLRCCGFNSLHDRAWPFPGRDVDSRACEVTFGYTRRCADVWQSQESTAAGLIALAGFLNWILLHIVETLVQQDHHALRIPSVGHLQAERTRLLGGRPTDAPEAEEHRHASFSEAE